MGQHKYNQTAINARDGKLPLAEALPNCISGFKKEGKVTWIL